MQKIRNTIIAIFLFAFLAFEIYGLITIGMEIFP